MDWVGVDPLHQVVTRDEAMDLIPWLSVRWQTSPPDSGHYFWWDDNGLALKSAAIDSRSCVHVDFLHGAKARRVKAVRGEALTRAMGCQKGLRPSIIDMTAGLGGDLSVLANVGCEVFAMDKNPVVAALLRDALRRATDADTSWCERIQFKHTDSVEVVSRVSHGIVYLDPMFPKERRAAPSLTMQVLHSLEQTTDHSERLLEAALDSDAARVVVKRPIKADILGARVPSSQIRAKTIRFDLYPKRKLTIDDCERFRGMVDA
ncbi:MAG: class I SAM-dependent methyltransferase [Pseudomonadota bacterium]|nr:class I SAM-dependent methyltransferase [Pseudomonadota bacterium]